MLLLHKQAPFRAVQATRGLAGRRCLSLPRVQRLRVVSFCAGTRHRPIAFRSLAISNIFVYSE